ncbi:MAG: PilZ domain-containing protein [Chlamydiota bacterium]
MTNPLRKLWRAAAPSRHATGISEPRPMGNELLLSDRRLAKRHFDPLPAAVRYGVGATEEQVGIYNFSEKGLCFRSGVRFPTGAAVEITTTLPRKPPFRGRKVRYLAHVVRVSMQLGEFVVAAVICRCETLAEQDAPLATVAPESVAVGLGSSSDGNEGSDRSQTDSVAVAVEAEVAKTSVGTALRDCRQFSRYPCASQVQFRTPDQAIASGELTNLSLAGCFVQTPQPCRVGASLEIVVQDGSARIYTRGRVKAVREKQGMAVEFVDDLPERLQRLPRFVQVVSASRQQNDHPSN